MKALLALSCLLVAAPAFAEKTVWLVRPLYPGQETLVGRTEQALDKLTPADQRANNIIGHKELATALKGKKVDEIPCFSDTRCADPIDPFVAALGFDRVVLVQGGQDEAGFKFKVVSYEPSSGRTSPASASDAILENALLGAVAKVVPVASSLDVKTMPPGATVFVDDKKAGVTPLSTQVLPGERSIRLDLKLHQPVEETVVVQMRGAVKVERTLEKVAARMIITASPAGTTITVDGQALGKDRVDRGVQPGTHTIRLAAEGYKAFEQTIQVKADEQFSLDKTLESLNGPPAVVKDGQAANAPPLSLVDQIYEKKSYFYVGFNYESLNGRGFLSHRFGDNGHARTLRINNDDRKQFGGTAEFGFFGKYFGMAAIGVDVGVNDGTWSMGVGRTTKTISNPCPTGEDDDDTGECLGQTIRARVVLATIRGIQPQFRIQLWRFMLGLQAGFALRLGHVIEPVDPVYNDGFMVFDVMAEARANARFYIVDGLFIYAQYRFSALLVSVLSGSAIDPATDTQVSSARFSNGFTGGIGYAF